MADEKRGAPDAGSGGKRRRPPATIELKATEVASEPVKPSEPIDSNVEMSSANTRVDANEAPEFPAQSVHEATPESPPGSSAEPKPDVLPEPPDVAAADARQAPTRSWQLLGAGLAGAAAALCVVLALWALGLFASRENLAVALAGRLGTLETQVRDLASKPQPVLDQRPLAELETRLAKVEQNIGRVTDLDARLVKAESAAAAARAATDQSLMDRVAALEAALRPLADTGPRIEAAAAAGREAKARADAAYEIAEKVANRPVAPTIDHGEIDALARRIAALEQVAKAVEAQIARAAATGNADRAGRLAFVATALRSAVERGEPFTPELAAAKSLMSDAALVAPLEPYAMTGVPRSAALALEFSQLAKAMLDAAGAAAPREGGIIERLQANAGRLVRVRPLNEGRGDEPAAIVTRAEAKAAQGDIPAALAELARLPEPVRAPALGWIKKAEAQSAALAAARKISETATAALGRMSP